MTGVPPSVTQAGQTSSTCSVGGQALGPTAGDSLKVWAGVPPLDPNAAQAVYAFREVAGRHQLLVSNDDAGVQAAVQAGGAYVFQVKTTNGNIVATLSRTAASAF
ncbi:MAG: hypothetical protein KF842_10350 [Caulobacter sp.]|nr:hypothetical protein [Caulobacter sp.]